MCGLIVNEKRESATSVKALYVKVDEALDETIKRLWVIETFGTSDEISSVHFDGNMYAVLLPPLTDSAQPLNIWHQAMMKLRQTERSLMRNPHKPPSRKGCERISRRRILQEMFGMARKEKPGIYHTIWLSVKTESSQNAESYLMVQQDTREPSSINIWTQVDPNRTTLSKF
ncbi:hypothetical protein T07_12440 [Trichinella nelsoni]|uniref:Uncharacterized protein n=1 Tax=Trichinella nelsoni TaxID=6336 RepID=A0A0V0SHQ7_9BILA|nr:hypothetical protein T07_12440 [Trichinella nelsoni]